jgi:hypothetical protein
MLSLDGQIFHQVDGSEEAFGGDELLHVRVGEAKYGHVGVAVHTFIAHDIENPKEGD